MSELKVYHCNEWHNEYTEFYMKHEADKVIAEKDEEIYNIKYSRDEWAKACNQKDKEITELEKRIADGDRDFEISNNQNERLLKIVRHHKYKRCLDNAEICCEKKENCYNRALRKYSKDEADYLVRKSNFWQDWEFRWLKIADKFKEAK